MLEKYFKLIQKLFHLLPSIVGDILDDLHAVVHELVVEDPVGDAHAHEDGDQVESLPECELLVVAIILAACSVVNEVLSNLRWS